MPADPHSGSKVWKAPDREIGKPGENRGKVIAHRNLQPSAAFHDREYRRNFRPGQWTANVQPVLSTGNSWRPGCLADFFVERCAGACSLSAGSVISQISGETLIYENVSRNSARPSAHVQSLG